MELFVRQRLPLFLAAALVAAVWLVDEAEGFVTCAASDRELEDLWSPMMDASNNKMLIFVRMLGAPAKSEDEPFDCSVAEWMYPDPNVEISRRGAPAMGGDGDLPLRGPAIVYCSLYSALRYVNKGVEESTDVSIYMASGVYQIGYNRLPPITRRTPLYIYGANKRGRTRQLPSLECAGESEDGRKVLPFYDHIKNGYTQPPSQTGMSSFDGNDRPGTGVKWALTTILRGSTGVDGGFKRGGNIIPTAGMLHLGVGAKVWINAIAFVGGEAVRGGAIFVDHEANAADAAAYGAELSARAGNMNIELLMHQGGLDQMSVARMKRLKGHSEKTLLDAHNCDFMDNGATYGGAVYVGTGMSNITNCHFVGNAARRCGGAMYQVQGFTDLNLGHTSFKHNHDRCADPHSQVAGPGEPRATIPMIGGDPSALQKMDLPLGMPGGGEGGTIKGKLLLNLNNRGPGGGIGSGPPPPGGVDTRGLLGFGDPITEAWAKATAVGGGGRGLPFGGSHSGLSAGGAVGKWLTALRRKIPSWLANAPPGTGGFVFMTMFDACVGTLLAAIDSTSFVARCAIFAVLVFLGEKWRQSRAKAKRAKDLVENDAMSRFYSSSSNKSKSGKKGKKGKHKQQGRQQQAGGDSDGEDEDETDTDWGPMYSNSSNGGGARRRKRPNGKS